MVWDVRGEWVIHQAPTTSITVNLDQLINMNSGDLTGDITGVNAKSITSGAPTLTSTSVTGAIIGNQFFLSIEWDSGAKGEYNGTFGIPPVNTDEGGPSRLWGVATDSDHFEDVAAWVSGKVFFGGMFGP